MMRNKLEFFRKHSNNLIGRIDRTELKIRDDLFLIKMDILPQANKTMLKSLLMSLDLSVVKINTCRRLYHRKAATYWKNNDRKIALVYLNKSFNETISKWEEQK